MRKKGSTGKFASSWRSGVKTRIKRARSGLRKSEIKTTRLGLRIFPRIYNPAQAPYKKELKTWTSAMSNVPATLEVYGGTLGSYGPERMRSKTAGMWVSKGGTYGHHGEPRGVKITFDKVVTITEFRPGVANLESQIPDFL